jgi:hypothetical protein
LEGFYLFVQTAGFNIPGLIISMCWRVHRPGIRKEGDRFPFPDTKNPASWSAGNGVNAFPLEKTKYPSLSNKCEDSDCGKE